MKLVTVQGGEKLLRTFLITEKDSVHMYYMNLLIQKKYRDKDRVNGNNVDVYEIYSISINADFKSD
jgi:hypothetical protein